MEWQAVVLVMQILMLAVGWFLFQQAKGELSARAAETPVMGEVKALQRSIKQLLADLQRTSEGASTQLEAQCRQARELAAVLEGHLASWEDVQNGLSLLRESEPATSASTMLPPLTLFTESVASNASNIQEAQRAVAAQTEEAPSLLPTPPNVWEQKRARVFALADAGQSAGAIARETGISEGEIETLLGLRCQRA